MTVSAGGAATMERDREILAARARVLARPADESAAGETSDLVAFSLGSDVYAVEARRVLGVFRLVDLTPVPGADRRIAGLTVWRGSLLTVMDLRQVLGLAATGLDDRAWVVVLAADGAARGLLAGALRGLMQATAASLREPGPDLQVDRRFVRAVTDDAVVVLEPDLFSPTQPGEG